MGETLNLLFRSRENGTFEIQIKENWSGRVVSGDFVPPYTSRQLDQLLKKLNDLSNQESRDQELQEVGQRLFRALCNEQVPGSQDTSVLSVGTVLRGVIQRTLKRRGTVALTLSFGPGCDEFIRYPWELLHNGDYFLLVSGIFTLSRALLRPDLPVGCELPVHLPMRVLYIGAAPTDCAPLEIERSYQALEQAFAPLTEAGQVFLDRLEPPTFDQLVRYFNSYGGASTFDDNDTSIPCYVVHFDGHGAYGRLCPADGCETVNSPEARKCVKCDTGLTRISPQTYLCFCDEDGKKRFITARSLRELLLSSDIRLAVFSACETASVSSNSVRARRRRAAVDATLATALVTAQVPAVVAMPFSLQDDLSPTFVFHFYEALADGRMLDEALARARQALSPMQQKSWFVPVLYRHVAEGFENPVPLLADEEEEQEYEHPLSYLGASANFIGRKQELQDLDELLAIANGAQAASPQGRFRVPPGTHHIAITGLPGIGKSALAFEAVRRNRDKFLGGIIGVSLQGEKSFSDALEEMIHRLHIPIKKLSSDASVRARLVLSTFRSLANRELPCLLLLDSFEEINDRGELEQWLRFLGAMPQEVIVLVTSHVNPESMMVLGGQHCRWYEYRIGKMPEGDLLRLFTDLAASNGLDQQIHLDEPAQQAVLQEICTLLDGYPLGAELIFGTARSINNRVFTAEAASRSLEEIRDELYNTPLAGILAALEVAYQRLSSQARLLLAYLATFKLPFSRDQILMLVAPDALASTQNAPVRLLASQSEEIVPAELAQNWRSARDELVRASFMQFDGRVYTIHPQIRHFALTQLPVEARRRVHRVVAAYYYNQRQPSVDEWFAAFDHLESAGEPQDLKEAIRVAVQASHALDGRGYAAQLQVILRRAGWYASRLGDKTDEGLVQGRLGVILRYLDQYTEAEACLRSSLNFHQQEQDIANETRTLYELAALLYEESNFIEAEAYAQEASSRFIGLGNAEGEAWAALVLGKILREQGKYSAAQTRIERALSIFRLHSHKEGWAWALYHRARLYEIQGQSISALSNYEEAQRLLAASGLRRGLAWATLRRCLVLVQRGKLEEAEKDGCDALALAREQETRRSEAWALYALGQVMLARQNNEQARAHFNTMFALCNEIGDRISMAYALLALGSLNMRERNFLDAKTSYEQAQTIGRSREAKYVEVCSLLGLGGVCQQMHQFSDAERYYSDACALARELPLPLEQVQALYQLGEVAVACERYSDALDWWMQALALDVDNATLPNVRQRVESLVAAQHLEERYNALCTQYHMTV